MLQLNIYLVDLKALSVILILFQLHWSEQKYQIFFCEFDISKEGLSQLINLKLRDFSYLRTELDA